MGRLRGEGGDAFDGGVDAGEEVGLDGEGGILDRAFSARVIFMGRTQGFALGCDWARRWRLVWMAGLWGQRCGAGGGGGVAEDGAVEGVAGVVGAGGGEAHVLADLGALQAEADAGELDVA